MVLVQKVTVHQNDSQKELPFPHGSEHRKSTVTNMPSHMIKKSKRKMTEGLVALDSATK